jgi:predicted SAM-dependent methyltransferase
MKKLHLGCGSHYLKGWENIDISSKKADVHMDLTKPFPFPNDSIGYIYNEHFLEHLSYNEGLSFLKECFRVLIPRGVLRISTPNLRKLVDVYVQGTLNEWADVGFVSESPCKLMNDGMRLWEHKFLYDIQELEASLRKVGFVVKRVSYKESDNPVLAGLESRPYHEELIEEGRK